MDEGGNILPFIIGVLILLYRLFGGRKEREEQQLPPPPTHTEHPVPPPQSQPHKGQKSLLETIMEEVEKQKKLNEAKPKEVARPKTEIKQKSYKPEKRKPKKTEDFLPSYYGREELRTDIDKVEREEGVSSISDRLKRATAAGTEEQQERKFEFDPREAFMMKTLLERPYS